MAIATIPYEWLDGRPFPIDNVKGGYAECHLEKTFDGGERNLHVLSIKANNGPGSGYGTAAMREIFRRSMEMGLNGDIRLCAIESSHIFHLKMGFEPDFTKVNGENYTNLIKAIKGCGEGNTSNWGPLPMRLSAEGKQRWLEDLRGVPFISFRNFEHLAFTKLN